MTDLFKMAEVLSIFIETLTWTVNQADLLYILGELLCAEIRKIAANKQNNIKIVNLFNCPKFWKI
jgi:hypothetical protein